MYETFEKLPEDKRNQILQVCIEEFAINGYENTSTNTIVKRLGISKGVLFLYFKNKKNLYLYLVDHIFESYTTIILERFSDQMDTRSLDILDHMTDYFNIFIQEDPYAFKFIVGAILHAPAELRKEVEERHNRSHERFSKIVKTDCFRKDVDPYVVMNLVLMIAHHLEDIAVMESEDIVSDIMEYASKYLNTFKQYLQIIKYGVYEQKMMLQQ